VSLGFLIRLWIDPSIDRVSEWVTVHALAGGGVAGAGFHDIALVIDGSSSNTIPTIMADGIAVNEQVN
jgi:hypothetical protein